MNLKNTTSPTELLMVGLPGLGGFKILLFIFILLCYSMMVCLDITLITIMSTVNSLHTPMYFFLKNFLISEMILVSVMVPFMLHVLWMEGAVITIAGCMAQNYLCVASGSCECYLLTIMSYDRYLAICKPLHYNKLMSNALQHSLVVFCWLIGLLAGMIVLSVVLELKFCGQNVIDNFVCDHSNLVDLGCSDTTALKIQIFVMSFPIMVIPFALVIWSYMSIVVSILRMSSVTGRKKVFSTCSSHLSVVVMFYGILIIDYFMAAKGNPGTRNKILFIVFIVLIPLLNPIIYSLRNQDIHVAVKRNMYRRT